MAINKPNLARPHNFSVLTLLIQEFSGLSSFLILSFSLLACKFHRLREVSLAQTKALPQALSLPHLGPGSTSSPGGGVSKLGLACIPHWLWLGHWLWA